MGPAVDTPAPAGSHPESDSAAARLGRHAETVHDAIHAAVRDHAHEAAHVAKAAVATGALAATVAASASPAAAATVPAAASAAGAVGPLGAQIPAAQTSRSSPGVEELHHLCKEADTGICARPKWSEERLLFDAVLISRYVNATWRQIKTVGGWRPADPYPDHPSGRAVDIMMPNGGRGGDQRLGDEIADYFQKHAKEFGVDYILWRQQQWSAGDPVGKWRSMSDRGSPTANHVDHIHITVKGSKSTGVKELLPNGGAGQQAKPADPVLGRVVVTGPLADR